MKSAPPGCRVCEGVADAAAAAAAKEPPASRGCTAVSAGLLGAWNTSGGDMTGIEGWCMCVRAEPEPERGVPSAVRRRI